MPFLLGLDIACLTLSLALSSGLALVVCGAGLDKPLNRNFVLFTTMEAGFIVCSLLLRLSLHFRAGNPQVLLECATLFFALSPPFLLLFCVRYSRVRGWWPIAAVGGVIAGMLVLAAPLAEGKLVADPWMSTEGLVFYRVLPLGLVSAMLPTSCLLASFVLLATVWRRENTPSIALSVGLLLAGFLVGGIAQPRFPLMAITSMASVALLGWGIIRRQLFNPLRELASNLRERSHRQELISQISRRTATLLRLDELLGQAATLIRDSFDYFTVAVFLVSGDELVLKASTHPAAPQHINNFRLKVGQEGICGWVAAAGRPLVVGDVSRESRYVSILDSAKTLSELAVPILRSDRVIGVLDVQSSRLDAFSEMDVLTQQTIADQLSSSLLSSDVMGTGKKKPAIIISLFTNGTDEHIDILSLTNKLRTDLIKTGRFIFLNERLRKQIAEEYEYQSSGYVSPETAKMKGKQIGADWLISGHISSIRQPVGKKEIVYYKTTLEVTDLETSQILWTDEVELKKAFKRKNVVF